MDASNRLVLTAHGSYNLQAWTLVNMIPQKRTLFVSQTVHRMKTPTATQILARTLPYPLPSSIKKAIQTALRNLIQAQPPPLIEYRKQNYVDYQKKRRT